MAPFWNCPFLIGKLAIFSTWFPMLRMFLDYTLGGVVLTVCFGVNTALLSVNGLEHNVCGCL